MAATKTTRKPAAKARKTTVRARRSKLTAELIRERAYFIHLDEGGDEIANWLRAERELAAV